MSFAQQMESLKKLQADDLDFNNIGSWPAALKVIVCALVFVLLLVAGYQFHLKDLRVNLPAGDPAAYPQPADRGTAS